MLSGAEKPAPAVPLMKAGIWWPGRGLIGVDEWRRVAAEGASGVVPALSAELAEEGILLEDGPSGTTWRRA